MTKFWCGNSSKTGARCVAYIDLALAISYLIFGFLRLTWASWFQDVGDSDYESTDVFFHFNYTWGFEQSVVIILLILLFVFTAEICLICLLMNGVSERNPDKCSLWIKIRILLLLIGMTGYIYELARHEHYMTELTTVLIVGIFYRLYTLLLVREFKYELDSYRGYYELGFFNTKT